jgi:hypothetical protein
MGMKCQIMPVTASPFDILVEGVARVEVKVARYGRRRRTMQAVNWQANIHRHNVVSNGTVDFFVVHLPAIKTLGFRSGIQLVIPGEDLRDVKTVSISARSLITRYAKYFGRWNDIKEFCERCRATEVAHDYDKVQEDFRARDAAVQVP